VTVAVLLRVVTVALLLSVMMVVLLGDGSERRATDAEKDARGESFLEQVI
jgi:hypothetical protein